MNVQWWKSMVMADANTMIRCIIGDDEKKIEELQTIRQTQKIVYTIEVIAEVVYVITKVYSVPRKACSEAILSFMKARNIVCRNGAVAERALLLYTENTLDFVDNILLAYHQVMGMTIYSYDKKLMKAINKDKA